MAAVPIPGVVSINTTGYLALPRNAYASTTAVLTARVVLPVPPLRPDINANVFIPARGVAPSVS